MHTGLHARNRVRTAGVRPFRLLIVTSAVPLAAALPATATEAAPTASYSGNGGQAPGFKIELNRHGRALRYSVMYQAPCNMAGVQDNREWGTGESPDEVPLHLDRHGRFHEQRRGMNTGYALVDLDFAGRLGRNSAHGTFSIKSTWPEVTCTTGLVHWTARKT
jgi:hypothetical protein